MAEIIQLIKIALCTASFFFLCVAATRMNLNKADRAKQFLMPVVALVYCILTLCFLNPIYQILFGGIHMLEGLVPYVRELQLQRYLIYLANLFMVVGFLVVKAIALPILRRIWERLKELAQATSHPLCVGMQMVNICTTESFRMYPDTWESAQKSMQ